MCINLSHLPITFIMFLLNSNSNMCIDLSHLPIDFIVFLEYNRTLLHMIDDAGHGLVLIESFFLNVKIKYII
jgi:hypothetical protein